MRNTQSAWGLVKVTYRSPVCLCFNMQRFMEIFYKLQYHVSQRWAMRDCNLVQLSGRFRKIPSNYKNKITLVMHVSTSDTAVASHFAKLQDLMLRCEILRCCSTLGYTVRCEMLLCRETLRYVVRRYTML